MLSCDLRLQGVGDDIITTSAAWAASATDFAVTPSASALAGPLLVQPDDHVHPAVTQVERVGVSWLP